MKQRYLVLFIGFVPAFVQQESGFSIDDVLSAPYYYSLTGKDL